MGWIKGIHIAAFVVWIGSMTFFSFVVAPTVFKNFPRETAGDIVGHIFPKYYAVCLGAGAVALGTLLVLGVTDSRLGLVKTVIVVGMLATQGYTGFVMRPQVAEVKEQVRTLEAVEGTGTNDAELERVRAQFGRLHRNAMILESIVLLFGYVAIVMTGFRL